MMNYLKKSCLNQAFAQILCKGSANRAKYKINLVYFYFRGAAYLARA